jgi:hypothetical protein
MELQTLCPIVNPPAAHLDEPVGADGRRMADDNDQGGFKGSLQHP